MDCDEYPYFATKEGGPANYPGTVYLEPVGQSPNRGAGLALGKFFKKCGIDYDAGPKSVFAVAPMPKIEKTIGICAK